MANHSRRPYNLPEMMTSENNIFENEQVNFSTIMALANEYITKHEQYLRRYRYLEALYKGFHNIFLLPEKEGWKPDNRLAVNFPRYMTETFSGYGYGIPIKVNYQTEDGAEEASVIDEAIQDFGRDNEINDHNSEMVKRCCIYGHAFEYLYQNEESKTKITACSPMEVFVVYDDAIRGRALFAVRYWYRQNDEGIPEGRVGEVMTRDSIYRFSDNVIKERIDNPYGYIPVVEWRMNDERIGLYEEVANLIETYNITIGEKANDVEAFAEAYLAIIGAPVDEDGVRRIRDDRLINVYGTDDARQVLIQFLSKPVADGTQENLLDRLENLIYETSMVANISDESFGNAASGVSLQYKLQAMSNLALSFDRKIEKSLKKRYKIFCSLPTNVSDPEAYKDLEITFTRNIPANTQEEIEAAKALTGIVSQETQLSRLSFVSDVRKEIEKLRNETLTNLLNTIDDYGYTTTNEPAGERNAENTETNES